MSLCDCDHCVDNRADELYKLQSKASELDSAQKAIIKIVAQMRYFHSFDIVARGDITRWAEELEALLD